MHVVKPVLAHVQHQLLAVAFKQHVFARRRIVVVRVAGRGWSNALRANAQAHPPRRELAEAPGGQRGKGCAVVGAQGLGQAILPKHPLEPGLDGSRGHAAQGAALQDKAAVIVGNGQGVAALAAGEPEVALEVGAPALCRGAAGDQGVRVRRHAAALSAGQGLSGSRARSRSMTFLGPKLRCASFICTMRSAISGAVVSGCRWGLRERS